MRRLRLAVGCLLCICLSLPAAAAESFPLSFRAPADLPKPVQDTLQALAQKHAERMSQHLELKIDQIDRDGGLSDGQRTKLDVAALGAVQDSLEEWLAPILSEFSTGSDQDRQSLLARLGGPDAAGATGVVRFNNGRVVFFQGVGVQQMVIQEKVHAVAEVLGVRPQPVDFKLEESAVLVHPIFTATLDAVLTDRQREKIANAERERYRKLTAAQTSRDAERAQTRTERLVREIGRRLALDEAQRKQVAGLIEQISRGPVVRWRMGRSGVSARDAAEFTLPYLPSHEMRQILTPGQWAVWNEIVRQATTPDPVVPRRRDAEQIINAVE